MRKLIVSNIMSLDGYYEGPVRMSWSCSTIARRPTRWTKVSMRITPNGCAQPICCCIGEEPWGDKPTFHMPVFVLTHEPRPKVVKEGRTTFTFVTDGMESALKQAKEAAGDRDVMLAGGANAVQRYMKAGVLDEISIHLIPVILGNGPRLFDQLGLEPIELESSQVIEAPAFTHLRFRVVG